MELVIGLDLLLYLNAYRPYIS